MLQAANGEPVQGADLAPAMRVHLVPTWNMPSTIHLQPPTARQFVELSQHLRARLPVGTQIEVDDVRRRSACGFAILASPCGWSCQSTFRRARALSSKRCRCWLPR
jgi:hypothetical protein